MAHSNDRQNVLVCPNHFEKRVSGFLGAGKTITIARGASHFLAEGKNVAIATNDQAADLVDTLMLRSKGFHTWEVFLEAPWRGPYSLR